MVINSDEYGYLYNAVLLNLLLSNALFNQTVRKQAGKKYKSMFS